MNKPPFLIDFDGVLKLGDKPAPDSEEFFNFIKEKEIPAFVISNSTLKTSEDIKEFFLQNKIKFDIPAMTASEASLKYISENYKRVKVFCSQKIKKLFAEFIVDENPEAVVVGDLADEWSYDILNEIFRDVYNGADLIAMQKNKFWQPDGKTLCLDAGAFISAIEYATGKEALLIGKPSSIYFKTALKIIGIENSSFYMLGDDLETDVNAAQKIGGKGILIYTGKTKFPLPADTKIKPDYEAVNLSDVIKILNKVY
ncbi:MAG TPA: HAD-IIA family hydrolase [Ignavibacteriaceae bacterium]|nr:HAD-IIA family hydrolase [Ignavibacteriaceae bacterium]